MFTNLKELINTMQDESVCREYLAKQRWVDGKAVCPSITVASIAEVQEILSRVKNEAFLTPPQKLLLEKLGKEATKEMYND